MPRISEERLECPCPPIGLIDVIGKKWAVCVVALLGKYGTVRFGPIQRCLSGVSPATLTATLRALEREGLVRREMVDSPREAVSAYALTDAGRILYRSLRPLAAWLSAARPGAPVAPLPAVGQRPATGPLDGRL